MKQVLSKEQKDIAFFNECEGAILVEASAGSGKTRILTERVRHLLTEKKDKFFSVLCLTFTNKAADEMKERLEDVPKLKERAFIGNFHEFCLNEILRKQRQEIGLEDVPHIFDDNDKKKIIEEVIYTNRSLKNKYDFPSIIDLNEKAKKQQDLISKCVNFISDAKRKLIIVPKDTIEWANWKEDNTFLYKNYNYQLENQNAIDYDDILLYAYRILVERPRVSKLYRKIYQYILVDEAQDLNYAQYQILKAICGDTHRNLMMVGDPKQAIYAFNGASPNFMQNDFVRDFEAERKEINHNYRSSTKVLELAEHIQPNGGIPNNYFKGIRKIQHSFDNEEEEANWIIESIKEWVERGTYEEEGKDVSSPIAFDNIAVLGRTRYVFKKLITQLEEDDLLKNKFYLRKGSEKFEPESQLMKIFDWGLRIIVNPLDVLHFNQIYQLLKLQPPNDLKDKLDGLLNLHLKTELSNKLVGQIKLITESWQEVNNNPNRLDLVLEKIKTNINDLDIPDEEKLAIDFDIEELKKLWKGFLMNTPTPKQNLSNFRYFLAMRSIDQNKKGLTLGTIHTVKGLEFEIVFLMGMNEGVLPYYKAKNRKALLEERNNAYVAVTRAKKCIYVTSPKTRMMPWNKPKNQTVSRFIQDFECTDSTVL